MIDLPDLIAITADDPSWTWDTCVACQSSDVTDRALYIRRSQDRWQASRVAWCAGDRCQRDLAASSNTIRITAQEATRSHTPAALPLDRAEEERRVRAEVADEARAEAAAMKGTSRIAWSTLNRFAEKLGEGVRGEAR